MCDYCKELGFGEDLFEKELKSKKVMEICGESVNIALSMESYPDNNKRLYFLAGYLDGNIEDIMDKSLTKVDINFCPFCGRKLE